ncbi:hypothetical protein G7046_g3098 [Stylonectria norvegica]|nr:hypothetical protein G7046_g3098 [Stylonectria norvegica]
MPKATFTISRALIQDAARLGEISTRAFDTDTHSQMKIICQKHGAFADGMVLCARNWIDSPETVVIKATNENDLDGTIVGSVAWGFMRFDLDIPPVNSGDTATLEVDNTLLTIHNENEVGNTEPIPGEDRTKELDAMTTKYLLQFKTKILPPGTKCMFIRGISIHPDYESLGIGSQLLNWGTKQADRKGAVSWVHSSEAGWPFFAKHGFKEVERLTVDLDEWSIRPPPRDGVTRDRAKWGEYSFRYMLRQPVGM